MNKQCKVVTWNLAGKNEELKLEGIVSKKDYGVMKRNRWKMMVGWRRGMVGKWWAIIGDNWRFVTGQSL